MKKKNLHTFLVVAIIPIIYLLINTGFKTKIEEKTLSYNAAAYPDSAGFLNVIYNDDPPKLSKENVLQNLTRIKDSLHFNAIQIYGTGHSGGFNHNINDYKNYVDEIMDSVANRELSGIYGRERFSILCNAQSLTYEVSQNQNDKTVNNGFSYQTRNANSCSYMIDSGKTVLHSDSTNSAGIICKDIYENLQHSDLIELGPFHGDDLSWFMRPSMRIKQSDFSLNDSRPVVAIYTRNFRGDIIDTVIIRVNNFRNDSNLYHGNYINNFTFIPVLNKDTLQISGSVSDSLKGLNYTRNRYIFWQYEDTCKVDFQIYWYGQVEVWFDKLTVMNERANNFFSPDTSISHSYERKIIEEVNAFWTNPGLLTFFVDELVYSNIEPTKRVMEIIKNQTQYANAQLMICLATTRNCYGMKNDTIGIKLLADALGVKRVMMDAHEITGTKVPPAFNNTPSYPDVSCKDIR